MERVHVIAPLRGQGKSMEAGLRDGERQKEQVRPMRKALMPVLPEKLRLGRI